MSKKTIFYDQISKIPEFYSNPSIPDGDFETGRFGTVFSGGYPTSLLHQCLTYINSNATVIYLNNFLELMKQMFWDKVQKANEKSNNATKLNSLGKSKEAENLFLESLKIHPTPEAYVNLSKLLIQQERHNDAELVCRRAIRTTRVIISDGTIHIDEFDVFSIAYSNLGIALHSQGKFEDAENCYRFATIINPSYSEAYSNLANLFLGQNRQNEAEDTYRNAIANAPSSPNSANAYTNLGSLLANQDRLNEAEDSWRKAITVNPNFALAYLNLGLLLSDQNRITEANHIIKKALQLDPSVERYLQ